MVSRRAFGLGWVLLAAAATPGLGQGPVADTAGVADARRFLDAAERELAVRNVQVSRAGWIGENFITHDTELLSADAQADFAAALKRLVTEARRFDAVALPPELARRLRLLKLLIAAPAPPDSAEAVELARLGAALDAAYGRGQYCTVGAGGDTTCRNLDALEQVLAVSRNPDSLRDAWGGWQAVGKPMRDQFARFVQLADAGARGMGFADAGAMWRAGYDMPPDSFVAVVDSLWREVRPLYVQLHAYVRRRLVAHYGAALVPPHGLLPVDLLGNMWGQDWTNITDLLMPPGPGTGVDLTGLLTARHVTPLQMVRMGERFYTSLGFDSLPATFWERSLFVRPRDRDVVCHASAWYIDDPTDLRIKMCITPTGDDFTTIHHELGHDFYFRSYRDQPFLYQNGANDGFHEAIGDAIALSVTPRYLVQIGLLDSEPPPAGDTLQLLRQALDHVAFLPFGITIDKWRWEVFAGRVAPADYTKRWWELRGAYGGVAPPGPRDSTDFDPGAKYHVPANVPYMRYFLAQVLEFQFYRALCRAAGHQGPLYRCSFYGSREAGRRLQAMLRMGASRPWPDALEALTGQRQMDATALLDYFQPLRVWLERQNRGAPMGW
jgi:peptidyl-dipeptidase A